MTQQLYSYVFIPEKQKLILMQKVVHECSQQLISNCQKVKLSKYTTAGECLTNCSTPITWNNMQQFLKSQSQKDIYCMVIFM